MKVLKRFPVSSLLLIQYLCLAIIPAVFTGTPGQNLMLTVLAFALAASLFTETAFLPLRFRAPTWHRVPIVPVVALAVLGLSSGWLASFFGASSYGAQIGRTDTSPLAALFTPMQGGALIGAILLLYLTKQGAISYRIGMGLVSLVSFVELLRGVYLAILGPSISFVFAVGVTAWILGLVTWRWFMAGVLVTLLAWPAVYAVRNERRMTLGAMPAEIGAGLAVERFLQDESFSQIRLFDPPVRFYGSPSTLDLLRFGLIPRFLDNERSSLNSGSELSIALGGSSRSSASVTLLGGAYLFGGWLGLALFSCLVSSGMALAVRSSGPAGLVVSGLLIKHFLWIGSTFPDTIAGFLQAAVIALLSWAALGLWVQIATRRQPASEFSRA